MNNLHRLLMFTCCAFQLCAATWHASPFSTGGSGSLADPWRIDIATTNTAVQPGDVLLLRGGIYKTAGVKSTLSGTSESPIIIKSYTGERVLITDGNQGFLGDNLPATSSDAFVIITNSESWRVGCAVLIGTEFMQLAGHVSGNATNWQIYRSQTPTTHQAGDLTTPYPESIISQTGSYVWFMNFEVASVFSTNRIISATNEVPAGLNFDVGVGNKAINLIVYNTGHPGIGFWDQSTGGEINGCVIWGAGKYDNGGAWVRGGGIYAQNVSGAVVIKNNIFFRNFRAGCSMFGSSASVSDFQFLKNISFAPGASDADSAHFQSDSTPMTNNAAIGNILMPGFGIGYTSRTNRLLEFSNNLIVNSGVGVKEFLDGTVVSNVMLFPTISTDASSVMLDALQTADRSQLNFVWDYNTYWFKNLTKPSQYFYRSKDITATAADGSGNLHFQNDATNSWKDWSVSFDAHSTYSTTWPTDYMNVTVQPLDYDTNRWHIAIVNTSSQTSTTIDLANSCGFMSGQRYQFRDAQNYFTVIGSGTYGGSGTINLPLNLTNVSTINGTLTHMTNKHTNVDYPGLFNAFVLERLTGVAVNVGTLRANSIKGR